MFLLQKDPRYKTVKAEVPIGVKGATADAVATAYDGTIHAWELTISSSNIISNAMKYQNTAFASITFLCRDFQLQEAVKSFLLNSQIDSDVLSKINCMHIGALLMRQRKLSAY